MLYLIMGPSGTGKTSFLLHKAEEFSRGGKRVFLIVPEQYSFETEKAVSAFLSGGGEKVEAVSFSRLSNLIFREFGGLSGDTLSDSGRTMLMSMVLDEVGETLSVYDRHAKSVPFASKALAMLDEFKNSALSPETVASLSEELSDGPIGEKLGDLSLIYSTYEAMLQKGRHDARDDLMRALALVRDTGFFAGAVVMLDGFFSFPKAELLLIACALQEAEEVYVSLCCDGLGASQARAFDVGRDTARKLLRIARENGAAAAPPVLLTEPYRFQAATLSHVAGQIPYAACGKTKINDGSVLVAQAGSRYEEVRFVAASIRRMVREEGLRYRDMVVIARSVEDYQTALEDVFARYGIPCFMDERIEVQHMPLMTLVTSLVDVARSNFSTEDILRHLKTGLLDLDPDAIYLLEGYCGLWGVDRAGWTRPFQQNPAGMKTRMEEEDKARLEELEAWRQAVMEPLAAFKDQVRGSLDGERFARAIFDYLEQTGVPGRIENLSAQYERAGEKARADELYACWDLLMGLLEQFSAVLGRRTLGLKRLGELLSLAVADSDLGHIPQTLDQVTVGAADRIRPSGPKVTVILGANEGSFPLSVPPQSLISQSERLKINRLGEQVFETLEDRFYKEFTYIYTAVTSPSHKLMVTYPTQDTDGKPLFPAPFVSQLCAMVEGLRPVEVGTLSPEMLVENEASAMDTLAEHLREDTALTASLAQVVERREPLQVQNLFAIAENRPYLLEDEETARKLLGHRLRLSPSRLERFYRCPFQYFCRDMLRLEPKKRAEFSPVQSGTLIHYVLEQMVSAHGARGLKNLSRAQLREESEGLLREYLHTVFGEEIPKRMQYLFLRLSDTLVRLLRQLSREFAQSAFEPADFELPISEHSENKPVELVSKTGERVLVEGVVDRVDIADIRGRKYVRVVDYKSGVKQFSLSDVAHGLNMQMLIYLFSLWENGAGKYKDCYPAGVLYLPAKSEIIAADRHVSDEEMEAEHQKTMKMNGLILEDEAVVEAMEEDVRGVFIPAKKKKDGSFDKASSLASLARFGKLSRYVDDQITAMADALRGGKIQASPTEDNGLNACAFCDYQAVCKHEREDGRRSLAAVDKDQFYSALDERYGEGE
ncbi:PD-(D/E)XK nuclease family protein [Zongyangia hominis]|uniref:Exodeoxyribonuclease V subunit gamma n=1 Tax=Zongyangia hominis TaxID=2763677 RepID=A0A926EC53_9FIRM|nr:PD-(D/E)XK nuclease family protein [Zongyangia hominis]MBC8569246.1 exodeoxyribonuclease V subunit gamma [Zongyangia hominis]